MTSTLLKREYVRQATRNIGVYRETIQGLWGARHVRLVEIGTLWCNDPRELEVIPAEEK